MSKLGHEAPLLDNTNLADISPHANDAQLRIGQEAPESQPAKEQVPPELQLSEKEQERIDRLVETGVTDVSTAIRQTVSPAKWKKYINQKMAAEQLALRTSGVEQRKQAEKSPGISQEELKEILRDTSV